MKALLSSHKLAATDKIVGRLVKRRVEAEGQILIYCYCASYPYVGIYKRCAPGGGGCGPCNVSRPC